MHEASEWRSVYLIPAIIGITACTIVLFFAGKTDDFIDFRIKYLKMNAEENNKRKTA